MALDNDFQTMSRHLHGSLSKHEGYLAYLTVVSLIYNTQWNIRLMSVNYVVKLQYILRMKSEVPFRVLIWALTISIRDHLWDCAASLPLWKKKKLSGLTSCQRRTSWENTLKVMSSKTNILNPLWSSCLTQNSPAQRNTFKVLPHYKSLKVNVQCERYFFSIWGILTMVTLELQINMFHVKRIQNLER